jgi:hypothetical protein
LIRTLFAHDYYQEDFKMRAIRFISLLLLSAFASVLALPGASPAQVVVGVAIHVAPPALPVYEQPVCPHAGFMWTPGYWAYGEAGYYWVPGTWVAAPRVGFLWTPGYWAWGGGVYMWHGGYWGPHIGFYGGVNYGFGYGGVGFVGGRWNGGVFAYNSAVMHVNTTVIHNTYVDRTVVNNTTVNRTSFNGGEGGVKAEPTAAERSAEHEEHTAATHEQSEHEHAASTNTSLRASENHGQPAVAATSKAGDFSAKNATAAKPAAHSNSANSANGKSSGNGGAHASSASKNDAAGGASKNAANGGTKNASNADASKGSKPAGQSKKNGGRAGGKSKSAHGGGQKESGGKPQR